MGTIYTNLDTNNIIDEIRTHLRSIKNKDYIKDVLKMHLEYKLITQKEYNNLRVEFGDK